MKRVLAFLVCVTFFASMGLPAWAKERDPLVKLLIKKGVITEQEIQEMEKELTEAKPVEVTKKEPEPAILKQAGTKLKLSGRWAAGFFDSQEQGTYPGGSFRAPEAKLRFDFKPDSINEITMRLNLNDAQFQNLDYFYIDSKDFIPCLKDSKTFTLSSRIGRMKLDYGEETWSNNPVESALISNSASNVAGNDEGLQLFGKIIDKVKYAVSITNGNTATNGIDNNGAKAYAAKLAGNPIDELYLSASFYNSQKMKGATNEISIAGLQAPPTNATNWDRVMWEADARYDFKKGKKPLDPPAYTDSKAYIRLAYGQFRDSVTATNRAAVNDRNGDYGFAESLCNVTDKVYTAYRYSIIDLDSQTVHSLNGVNASKQQRHSLGLGYRWSEKTLLKGEYSWNEEDAGDPRNDQVSAVVSSSF